MSGITIDQERMKQLTEKFQDHHYTKFLKGKSVVVVGPNTKLKGKKLGKYIDSFDVVIRMNTVFDFLPFDDNFKRDFGSRTDVIYWSPTCIKTYSGKRSTLNKLKRNKIKYICYQNGNKNREYMELPYCFPEPLQWFKDNAKRSGTNLHFAHHVTQFITDTMNANSPSLRVVPRTGYLPIFDALIHQANRVETIGLVFADQGGSNSFRPDALKNLVPTLNHDGTPSPHDSNVEEAVGFKLMEIYPHFKYT